MNYAPPVPATRGQIRYEAPDGALVYLINETVNGGARRRLAATFVLDCLRSYRTREETEACLHELDENSLLQLAADVRELTSNLGLN